ncbi:MAG: helix-turn-helix domain-containing protein [Rickettsiella sp.]|nr:helix-turn-helix domain-containing protein [Rickettsiella sp.]
MEKIYTDTRGYRIRLARKTLGLTQIELAKQAQTTQQTIHDYEKNKRGSYADTNLLINISTICKVTIDWLLTGKTISDNQIIPILTSTKALLTWLKQNKSDCHKQAKRIGFYLRDDSMLSDKIYSDSFHSKDIIIISSNIHAVPNDYVIVTTPFNRSPILFRQLLLRNNRYLLKPLNKKYPILPIEDPIEIIGTIIEQRRQFLK